MWLRGVWQLAPLPSQSLGFEFARGGVTQSWGHRTTWSCLTLFVCSCGLEDPGTLLSTSRPFKAQKQTVY